MNDRRPWFKFNAKEFLSDEKVRGFSWETKGVLIELWSLMWRSGNCSLPNNTQKIAKKLKISEKKFKKIFSELMDDDPIFFIEGDKIYSKRLVLQKDEIIAISESRRGAARKRWKKNDANADQVHNRNNANADQVHSKKSNFAYGLQCDPDPDPDPDLKEHASGPFLIKEKIIEKCEQIARYPVKKRFNPYQFANAKINDGWHPDMIFISVCSMFDQWDSITSPWGWGESVLKSKQQMYNEKKHTIEARKFKEIWNPDPRLKKLISNIGE